MDWKGANTLSSGLQVQEISRAAIVCFFKDRGHRHGKKKADPTGQREEFWGAVELFRALAVVMTTQIRACVNILRRVRSEASVIVRYLKSNIKTKAGRLLTPADVQRQKNTAGIKNLGAGLKPGSVCPDRKLSVATNGPG